MIVLYLKSDDVDVLVGVCRTNEAHGSHLLIG